MRKKIRRRIRKKKLSTCTVHLAYRTSQLNLSQMLCPSSISEISVNINNTSSTPKLVRNICVQIVWIFCVVDMVPLNFFCRRCHRHRRRRHSQDQSRPQLLLHRLRSSPGSPLHLQSPRGSAWVQGGRRQRKRIQKGGGRLSWSSWLWSPWLSQKRCLGGRNKHLGIEIWNPIPWSLK